jgi:thiamine biosynthesis protein ThiS
MESAETKTIEVVVNGEARSVPEGLSLDRLLVWLAIDPSRVAVERNRSIARKSTGRRRARAKDQLEIVWFVGADNWSSFQYGRAIDLLSGRYNR